MKKNSTFLSAFLLVLMVPLSFNQAKATPLSASITSSGNVFCYGRANGFATVTATGGSSPYTYLWSDALSQTAATATGLSAGNYTVVVTDAASATATASVSITQPTMLLVGISGSNNVLCNGLNDGSLTPIVGGGTPPYTYSWVPFGGTNAIATGLSAGCYTVTVTDDNGCTASASSCVTQPTLLTATMTSIVNPLCNGSYTGSLQVTPAGGTSPYTYAWSIANTTQALTGLSAGCYSVTVTDNNGCTATASACLTQPTLVTATITAVTYPVCNSGFGSATVTAGGGTSPYSYLWAPVSETTATATGLSAGSWTVTVIDNNGCTATASVSITQPPLLTATMGATTNNTNCASPNGSATVIAGGGTPNYTYLWNPTGQTNAIATGLGGGSYTCTVTDYNGCTATASVYISSSVAPTLTLSSTHAGSYLCNGTATASATGGVSPYTYLWSPGGQTLSNLTGLCAGTYCCKVTDNSGCIDSNCVIVDSCINTFDEPICIITLDTVTNKCELIWGRTSSPPSGGFGHYNIYRDSASNFTLTHTQLLNVLSEYIDPNSNPSAGPVSYKISTFDSCGESTLSPVHTSIYLTTTSGFNVYILNWTAYIGFTPLEYVIFRGPSLSTLVPIDTLPNTTFTFHDTLPPLGSYYVLEAVSPSGPCVPSTHRANTHSISLLSGSFSNGFNTAILGINNLNNEVANLNIYPNPSNGMFTLSYNMTQGDNVRISIINELGQEVYSEQKHINGGTNREQLNIENLASGIYSLSMQTENGIVVRKLLIMPNK